MSESRWMRWGGLVLIGVLAAIFASFNSGERVALSLGVVTFYRIPLVGLVFGAFVAGMLTMFLLGLRHDLRVRRALRDAGFGEPSFAPPAEEAAPPAQPLSGQDDRTEYLSRFSVPPAAHDPPEPPPP
jgi:uncharacterized integral membrane protein